MAKEKAPYVSLEAKQSALQASLDVLNTQFNAASEADKPALQEQINEAQRKIRWYEGRKNSPKFQAKATAATQTPEASADPTQAASPATEV